MLNILLLDSSFLNNKVIRQDTEIYLQNKNITYCYFEVTSDEDALQTVIENKVDISFIDISSHKYDGIKLLKDIKALTTLQPKIIAVTTLSDREYRFKALRLGISKYIYKPYDNKEIESVLEDYLDTHYVIENKLDEETDDFIDFDDDKFMDFDDDNEINHSKELMNAYNDSHKQLSAQEFLSEYKDIGYETEDLEDLEEELDGLVANILFDDNLEGELPDIIYMLQKYNRFLYTFTEFEELSKVLTTLTELLESIDFTILTKSIMVSKFIVAIIQDLVDWKEHVFVLEDAVDVYYINASILNSYIQLKDIVNK